MKYCPNCGSQIDEGAQYCNICGTKLAAQTPVQNANPNNYGYNPNYQSNVVTPQKGVNVNAIIGFVTSLSFYPVGLVFSILGLIDAKKTNHGKGLAIAGIIIASILTFAEIVEIIQQLILY